MNQPHHETDDDVLSDSTPGSSADVTRRGVRSVVKMIIGRGAVMFVALVSGFLVPRLMGPHDYGLLSAVIALMVFTQQISGLGLSSVGFRYLGSLWFGGKKAEAEQLTSSLWSGMVLAAALSSCCVFFWLLFEDNFDFDLLFCLMLGVMCFTRNTFMQSKTLLIPLGKIGTLAVFDLVVGLARLTLTVSVYLFLGVRFVFVALAILAVMSFGASVRILRWHVHLAPDPHLARSLSPYLRYSLLTYLGSGVNAVQTSLPVYVIAAAADIKEAAFLAIAVQAMNILRGLVGSIVSAMIPILAQFDLENAVSRFHYWGGFMLRSCVLLVSMCLAVWILMGRHVVSIVLTDQFAEVYQLTCLAIGFLVIVTFGRCHNRLVNIKGFAGLALGVNMVHLGATLIGFLWVLYGSHSLSISHAILWVNIFAALVYSIAARIMLVRITGPGFPLGSAILICLPAPLPFLLGGLELTLVPSLVVTLGYVLAYSGYALLFIKLSELRVLWNRLRERSK